MWKKLLSRLNCKYTQRELAALVGISLSMLNRLKMGAKPQPDHAVGERIRALYAKEFGK